ncbi:hypothetical protein GCM10027347_17470 [Larkinella harenae]
MKTKKLIFFIEHDANKWAVIQYAFQQAKCPHLIQSFANDTALLTHLNTGHQRPNLIIIDHDPPHVDGIQSLKMLKEQPKFRLIPVVIWNNQTCEDDIRKFYDMGATSYIEKSSELDKLVPQVELLSNYWFEIVHLPPNSIFREY